jgi:hypothetical protein
MTTILNACRVIFPTFGCSECDQGHSAAIAIVYKQRNISF